MATAYAAFPGAGRLPVPTFNQEAVAERRRVFSAATTGRVLEALQNVVEWGTASSLQGSVGGRLAAKTGTTDGRRDSWFVAIRPSSVTVVWVGTDGNRETALYGATGALEVWREINRRLPSGGRNTPPPRGTAVAHPDSEPTTL